MSQDSGFSDKDYNAELDRTLQMYEEQAENETFYLLRFNLKLKNSAYELECGLSPARVFSPVIILKGDENNKIVCSTYEWTNLIDVLKQMQKDFFVNTRVDNFWSPPIQCGELKIFKLGYGRHTKHVMVENGSAIIDLNERDVDEITKVDQVIISHQINILNNLNFCEYYYNRFDDMRKFMLTDTSLSLEEIMYDCYCGVSNEILLDIALKQYFYYCKGKFFSWN